MDANWSRLYDAARAVLNPREISEKIAAGGVAAAVETEAGHIYTGVCVDSACTLGICAERNAIFNMITNGESRIRRVIAVNWIRPPAWFGWAFGASLIASLATFFFLWLTAEPLLQKLDRIKTKYGLAE